MAQTATAPIAGGATPGAEDGSQPPTDGTDPNVHADATGDAGDGAGPDDDDEDEDFSDVPFNEHPRFKQLTRKLAKTRRQLAKARPLADRVKDVDLDALTVKARTSDELQTLLAQHPTLRRQVLEAMSQPAGKAAESDEPDFDPSTLPFDVSDESGKFFAQFYKEFRDLKKQNGELASRLKGMGEQSASQQRVAEGRTWKSAVDAAGAKVPEIYRDMFHDACYGAFKEARERNVRLDPQKVVDHYLAKLGGNKRTQDSASAAAAQRIAEANKKLPQQPAHPGGSAAAKGDRKETVADVNRRMKALFAR